MTRYKKDSFLSAVCPLTFRVNSLKNKKLSFLLISIMLSFSSVAKQLDDKEKHIVDSCNAYKYSDDETATLACGIYIRGFFNGMLNSANTDVKKIEKNSKSTSSFVERAYANRVGKRGERKARNYSCLTVDELRDKILVSLSDDSRKPFNSLNHINKFLVNKLTAACSSKK
ncbi:hypothetical protein [Thalassomonas sp. M1454]|uniref:hypothetical protein n=1 Tax=Thalassomonas sp. M1454 TaxID=2594477 RepID=UPI00117C026A|nr:hypothetical protein [Thalassomonas sp. M1454]TRX56445.1 hypothetical protein FNN08_02630 [Thalassomonas sp. M1454]